MPTRLHTAAWLLLLFVPATLGLGAEDIPYGVASQPWPERLGNHRARIQVEHPAEAVWVHLPWRRRGLEPEKKNVVVVDLTTGQTVSNIVRLNIRREFGDLVFQPATAPGQYGVYYLPCKHTGAAYFPNTVYDPAVETADPAWRDRQGLTPALLAEGRWRHFPAARVLAFEARSDFDRFDPMELIATPEEIEALLAQHPGQDWLLFPEDRRFPIRMTDDLPARWMTNGGPGRFAGQARPGEFYVFQVGVYAARRPVESVGVEFHDLVHREGGVIAASAMRCFNLGGSDWLGRKFQKEVSVARGKVQAFWFGLQIPDQAAPGDYVGTLGFEAKGLARATVEVRLNVAGELLADRGDNELWRLSRLRWLDSTVGIDDEVVAPYQPVAVQGQTLTVLGRQITLAESGLPGSLLSNFSPAVDSLEGPPREILAGPMRLVVETSDGPVAWRGGPPRLTERHPGAVRWESESAGGPFHLLCQGKLDCDGYINYTLKLRADREVIVRDIRLQIPLRREVAKYMMGLGCKGGARPKTWQWKWNVDRANNVVWLGDINAGLHCKLKGPEDVWELYNLRNSGLPESWNNDGQGGCAIEEPAPETVLVRAYTGPRRVQPGRELGFRFGLLATPVKLLDKAHWSWRYWHHYSPVEEVARSGANIINLHHANELNPYINYPFLAVDKLQPYVEAAHRLGIKVKLYYTIRELSNHAVELWALRSLGGEIFRQGAGFRLADQFVSQSADKGDVTTGNAWLCEHLITGYVPAWHHPYGQGRWDAAIATTGLSRWHNYYLEGMAWLARSVGVDGLYLDGIGYDRETMKRLRKVLDRARPGCLIDFHCGNHYFPQYGLNNIANQHLEHLPYINSLWLGEGFNYDETPDYWLVELSGMPFGLFGEMLGVGNPWRGMLYGQSNRLPYSGGDPRHLWKLWDQFGIQKARMLGYWVPACPVRTDRQDVLATAYVQTGKTLVALASWAKASTPVRLRCDWPALGLDPRQTTMRAPAIPGFQEERLFQPEAAIDVPPGRGWLLLLQQHR